MTAASEASRRFKRPIVRRAMSTIMGEQDAGIVDRVQILLRVAHGTDIREVRKNRQP